jgi:hypothetical protein
MKMWPWRPPVQEETEDTRNQHRRTCCALSVGKRDVVPPGTLSKGFELARELKGTKRKRGQEKLPTNKKRPELSRVLGRPNSPPPGLLK